MTEKITTPIPAEEARKMMSYYAEIKYLRQDERSAARDYSHAIKKAKSKQDKRSLKSIRKDEVKHRGKLAKIFRRLRA